jgi:hypothetical protein
MKFALRGGFAAAIALTAFFAAPARAEDGVTAGTITFGQAAVLEGPAAALGLGMRAGIKAAFDEANAKAGSRAASWSSRARTTATSRIARSRRPKS